MPEVIPKIKRLRTFREDVMSVRGSLVAPAPVAPLTTPVMPPPRKPPITIVPPKAPEKITAPNVTKAIPPPPVIKPIPPPNKPSPANLPLKKLGEIDTEIHTLNKAVPASLNNAIDRKVDVMEPESYGGGGGSIITDRKKKRFHVIPATWEALKKWVLSERVAWEKEKERKAAAVPKVRPPESRKEVVEKAASQSALAPKDDHSKVISRRPAAIKPTVTAAVVEIKSRDALPVASWSHYKGSEAKSDAVIPDIKEIPEIPPTIKVIKEPEPLLQKDDAVQAVEFVIAPNKPEEAAALPKNEIAAPEPVKKAESFILRHFISSSANKTASAAIDKPAEQLASIDRAPAPLPASSPAGAAPVAQITPILKTVASAPPITAAKPPEAVAAPIEPAPPVIPLVKTTAVPTTNTEPLSIAVAKPKPAADSLKMAERPEEEIISSPAAEDEAPPAIKQTVQPVKVPSYGQEPEEDQDALIVAPSNETKTARPLRFAPSPAAPLPLFRIVAVIAISSLFGIGLTVWLLGGRAAPEVSDIGQTSAAILLIASDQQVRVSVGNNRSDFLARLAETDVPSDTAITLLEPRLDISGQASSPSASDILNILNLRLPGSLTRGIEAINFGRYQGRAFIVLKVTSFETGFSGLLNAEPNLVADLYPLFGEPVSGTFDPSARTEDSVGNPFFVDSTVKNHDVRILRDESQNERLVYGFVNRNIIVIAADSNAFAAVAAVVK